MRKIIWISLVFVLVLAGCTPVPHPTKVVCPINLSALPQGAEQNCVASDGSQYDLNLYQEVDALNLGVNQVGIYAGLKQDQQPSVITDLGYSSYPQNYTLVYPTDVRDLYTVTDLSGCTGSILPGECNTSLTNILFSGSIPGTVDLSIDLVLKINQGNALEWMQIGGYNKFVGLFWGELRSYRTASSGITPNTDNIQETTESLRQLYTTKLSQWQYADMFTLKSLVIRTLIVGDATYQQSLADMNAQKLRAQQDTALTQQLLANEQTRQTLEEERAQFNRDMALKNAEAFAAQVKLICAGMTDQQACVNLVWVYVTGGTVAPILDSSGNLTSASATPVAP